MKSYSVMKAKAQKFADSRKEVVYICRAKRNNHHMIIFDKAELTDNHEIIEEVQPREVEG